MIFFANILETISDRRFLGSKYFGLDQLTRNLYRMLRKYFKDQKLYLSNVRFYPWGGWHPISGVKVVIPIDRQIDFHSGNVPKVFSKSLYFLRYLGLKMSIFYKKLHLLNTFSRITQNRLIISKKSVPTKKEFLSRRRDWFIFCLIRCNNNRDIPFKVCRAHLKKTNRLKSKYNSA